MNKGEKKTAPPIPLDMAMVAISIETGSKYQNSKVNSIVCSNLLICCLSFIDRNNKFAGRTPETAIAFNQFYAVEVGNHKILYKSIVSLVVIP